MLNYRNKIIIKKIPLKNKIIKKNEVAFAIFDEVKNWGKTQFLLLLKIVYFKTK